MSESIDENLSLSDVLDVLQEGLLPTGSAIMDGESQVWPDDEDELDIFFYPEGYEDEGYEDEEYEA